MCWECHYLVVVVRTIITESVNILPTAHLHNIASVYKIPGFLMQYELVKYCFPFRPSFSGHFHIRR